MPTRLYIPQSTKRKTVSGIPEGLRSMTVGSAYPIFKAAGIHATDLLSVLPKIWRLTDFSLTFYAHSLQNVPKIHIFSISPVYTIPENRPFNVLGANLQGASNFHVLSFLRVFSHFCGSFNVLLRSDGRVYHIIHR